jgi:hypothetical protein
MPSNNETCIAVGIASAFKGAATTSKEGGIFGETVMKVRKNFSEKISAIKSVSH